VPKKQGTTRKKVKGRLLLVLLSLLFALLVAEAFFQIFDPFHFGELEDREQFGQAIFRREGKATFLRPNTRASYLGKEVIINSRGMRNPEVSMKRPDGTFRILVVGDSVPFGWGVGDEEAFPRLLERMLNKHGGEGEKYEVINSAVPGWGIYDEYRFLMREGFGYEPNLILMMFINNDIPFHELLSGAPTIFFPFALRKIRVARCVEHVLRFFFDDPVPPEYDPLRSFAPEGVKFACEGLSRIKGACDDAKVPLVLLDTVRHEEIIQCCEELGLPRIALDIATEEAMQFAVAATDTHPNAEGHFWIAEQTYPELMKLPLMIDLLSR
jgi:hypothetical protein